MLNWIARNKTVWSFNSVYLQNVFTDYIFNIYVNTGFDIKQPRMVDMLENQTNLGKSNTYLPNPFAKKIM